MLHQFSSYVDVWILWKERVQNKGNYLGNTSVSIEATKNDGHICCVIKFTYTIIHIQMEENSLACIYNVLSA